MRTARHILWLLLVLSALTFCAGCANEAQQDPSEPELTALKSGDVCELSDGTTFTVPKGWSGNFYSGDSALYGEESLVGTISVLPRMSGEANISAGQDGPQLGIIVFRNETDAANQATISTQIWKTTAASGYLPPLFSFSPSTDTSVTGSVQFVERDSGYRDGISVDAVVVNRKGASFSISGVFRADDPLFKGTKSNAEMAQRVLEWLNVEY